MNNDRRGALKSMKAIIGRSGQGSFARAAQVYADPQQLSVRLRESIPTACGQLVRESV
jgi:hypothetical protein